MNTILPLDLERNREIFPSLQLCQIFSQKGNDSTSYFTSHLPVVSCRVLPQKQGKQAMTEISLHCLFQEHAGRAVLVHVFFQRNEEKKNDLFFSSCCLFSKKRKERIFSSSRRAAMGVGQNRQMKWVVAILTKLRGRRSPCCSDSDPPLSVSTGIPVAMGSAQNRQFLSRPGDSDR